MLLSDYKKDQYIHYKPLTKPLNYQNIFFDIDNENSEETIYNFKPYNTSKLELNYILQTFIKIPHEDKKIYDFISLKNTTLEQWKQLGFIIDKGIITNYAQFTFIFSKRDFRHCDIFLNETYKGRIFIKNRYDGWFKAEIIFNV
jgi:hypothetical protein